MSVSSVNSSGRLHQSIGGSTSTGASGPSDAAAKVTSTSTPESSSVVTLSPGAQALAAAAAAGISIGQVNLSNLGLSASEPMAWQIAQLQRAAKMLATEGLQNPDAGLSQSAFNCLVAQLDGTTEEATEVFKAFDTNEDGEISNREFETGLANALDNQSSPFAQELFRLINTGDTGSVSSAEFTSFETAFLQGETTLPWSS